MRGPETAQDALTMASILLKGQTPQDPIIHPPSAHTFPHFAFLALWGDIKLWLTARGREGMRRQELGVVHSSMEDLSRRDKHTPSKLGDGSGINDWHASVKARVRIPGSLVYSGWEEQQPVIPILENKDRRGFSEQASCLDWPYQ